MYSICVVFDPRVIDFCLSRMVHTYHYVYTPMKTYLYRGFWCVICESKHGSVVVFILK